VKRVLVYENRKAPPAYWDASTAELEAGAFLALFKHLDEDWQVYSGLTQEVSQATLPKGHPEACFCDECKGVRAEISRFAREVRDQKDDLALYEMAKKGDADAARALCASRKDHEYEEFKIEQVSEAKAQYAPSKWGVTAACGEAFIDENHVSVWMKHGKITSVRLVSTAKEALERFTDRILKFDPKKLEVTKPVTVKFKAQGTQTEDKWLGRELGIYMEDKRTAKDLELREAGLAMLRAGEYTLVNPFGLSQFRCEGCRREQTRFDE
jgi:uncharacterized protein with FMN-binding domain